MTQQEAERIFEFCTNHPEIFGITARVEIRTDGGAVAVVIHTNQPREYHIHFNELDEFVSFIAGVRFGRGGDPDRRL
jgi:hypothetical protein